MKAKTYSLDDIAQFSDWSSRITGNTQFKQFHKNKKEVEREYDDEEWKILLKKVKSKVKNITLDKVGALYLGSKTNLCFFKNKFVLLSATNARDKYRSLIYKYLISVRGHESIVELGCGYGSIIMSLAKKKIFGKKRLYAGELSKNGRELASLIAASEKLNVSVFYCDLTQNIIAKDIPVNSTIITSYSLCYQPHLSSQFINSILKLKPKIVFHFEPAYEHCNTKSLFGQLVKRYIEINDYNKNLVTVLKKAEEKNKIDILKIDPFVFGENPFLPVSVIIWKPKLTDKATI